MDVVNLIIIILTFAGFFLWSRAEARQDMRHLDSKLETNRNLSFELIREHKHETIDLLKEHRLETLGLIREIQQEMKDFHGRLCAIEERNREKQ